MKWIYGKQELKNLERGQENCYLLTNGLGGFSSLTMTGSVSRNDHALLMACVQAPNHRYNMVHRLKESLCFGKEEIVLSSQEFADGQKEEGCPYLSSFVFDDMPIWRFLVHGVEIRREIAMKQGENTVAVRYSIRNRSGKTAELKVMPFYQFTPKGSEPEPEQKFQYTKNAVISNGMTLCFQTNGTLDNIEEIQETYFYSYDACDGRRETGLAKSGHIITESVQPGEEKILKLVYSMENADQDADVIILEMQTYRKALEAKAGLHKEMAKELVKSASQFVSRRESTNGRTILAGYPFFEDWGRDTMIALPGVCISTGQYETAKEILRTFAVHERRGLMPNLFPEGGNDPLYNTVDAALLFINCVYLYYQAAGGRAFVQEMYPVMERIIKAYREGTDYGIHMDEDGLIQSGEGLWQVTWMDELAETADKKAVYTQLKEKVKASFVDKFWMDDKKCLKDLVSGTKADAQIRCNQIWAVSLTFTMLDPEKEQQVVETVFEKLYTPYGIRTLEQEDQEFHGLYQGKMEDRDMAYHQGTVWTFPLGAYYLAYLKVNQYSPEAKKIVREQLEVMEAAMREGCIGQLPEIYDGENPTRSKGCFAQAWSVGEILRVYEALEKL